MAELNALKMYQPLRENEIQLLRIDSDEQLEFSLIPTKLQNAPKYAALSYTWGALVLSQTIRINGHDFAVTSNLKQALVNLAKEVKQADYYFWIDAICINQHSSAERSAQVRLMSQIYPQSAQVFCWLGQPEDETDGALATAKIHEVAAYRREFERPGVGFRAVLSTYKYSQYGPEVGDNRRAWEAIARLSMHPWWARAWIIQEATCSESITLHYGSYGVLLSEVYDTLMLLRRLIEGYESMSYVKWSNHDICLYLDVIAHRRANNDQVRLKLSELVGTIRYSHCQDSRDKLYAVMSIASDIPGWLSADYTKSVVEVYIDYVRYSIEATSDGGKLGFLTHCGALYHPAEGDVLQDLRANPLPSWVPDWRCKTLHYSMATILLGDPKKRAYNADNSSEPDIHMNGLELPVKGFYLGDVQQFSQRSVHQEDPSLEMEWVRQPPFPDAFQGENSQSAMLRILACDVCRDGDIPVSRGHSIDFSYEARDHNSLTTEERRQKSMIRTILKMNTHNHMLMLTSNGHVGLAAPDAKLGDKICVLYGGPSLYVIRRNEGEPGCKFIGECYLDGFMDGQAAALLRDGSVKEEVFVLV